MLKKKNEKYKIENNCLKAINGNSIGCDPNQVKIIKILMKHQNKS